MVDRNSVVNASFLILVTYIVRKHAIDVNFRVKTFTAAAESGTERGEFSVTRHNMQTTGWRHVTDYRLSG